MTDSDELKAKLNKYSHADKKKKTDDDESDEEEALCKKENLRSCIKNSEPDFNTYLREWV